MLFFNPYQEPSSKMIETQRHREHRENLEINQLTQAIIGAAIEVHKRLGPGLLESAYRACLAYELRKQKFNVIEEKPVPVFYDEVQLECGFRADLLINNLIVVELKAKTAVHPVDKAQTLSHL